MGWFSSAPVKLQELGAAIGAIFSDDTNYSELNGQITELYKMYKGESKGGGMVRAVASFISAAVMPNGLSVIYTGDETTDGTAPPEVEFINAMLDLNNVNQGLQGKLILASQIEAKVLVKVSWFEDADNEIYLPKLTYLPAETTAYKFTTDPTDPEKIVSVKYKIGETEIDETFDNYAYVAFNALPGALPGYPDMGVVIQNMKNIDESLEDWQKMNRNFAISTPYFECETKDEADALVATMTAEGWKRGQLMAATAKFDMVSGDAGDYESVERKITNDAKHVSAATGVPVQHLGMPDELSNRSTADSLDDPAQTKAISATRLWLTFWETVFDIGIKLNNEASTGTYGELQSNVVEPDSSGVSTEEFDNVENVYLPMYKAGALTEQTLWERTPGVDATEESKRMLADPSTLDTGGDA